MWWLMKINSLKHHQEENGKNKKAFSRNKNILQICWTAMKYVTANSGFLDLKMRYFKISGAFVDEKYFRKRIFKELWDQTEYIPTASLYYPFSLHFHCFEKAFFRIFKSLLSKQSVLFLGICQTIENQCAYLAWLRRLKLN